MCTDLNLGIYDFILLNLRHEFCFWITHLRRLKNLFGEVELCCENWKCKVSNLDATNLYGFRRMSGPKLNDIPFVRSVHIDPLWGWGREMLAESGHSPILFLLLLHLHAWKLPVVLVPSRLVLLINGMDNIFYMYCFMWIWWSNLYVQSAKFGDSFVQLEYF